MAARPYRLSVLYGSGPCVKAGTHVACLLMCRPYGTKLNEKSCHLVALFVHFMNIFLVFYKKVVLLQPHFVIITKTL